MLRIALVSEWLDGWRGGAETSTLQFLHHLLRNGVEAHVFTRSRPSPTPTLHVHTVSGAAMSRTRQSLTFARRVERLLRERSFDIVHAITPCRGADVYQPRGGTVAESVARNLALRKSEAGRWLKRYANYFNVKQRYGLGVERRLFADPKGPMIVAISRYVAEQLKRHYGLTDVRIRLVYNAVNPDAATPEQRAEDRMRIRRDYGVEEADCLVVQVAHNFRLKGVQHWMEALARLVRGGGRFRSLVIGKGESDQWHRLAVRWGVEQYLTFTGPTDRVAAFLHAADVLVHPTYYDPCSRVVLEGMCTGLPCVTTKWDGASEVIQDGLNGYVLDEPGDVESLAERVNTLSDPLIRGRLGRAATESAEFLTMSRHVRQILEVYYELLARRGVNLPATTPHGPAPALGGRPILTTGR